MRTIFREEERRGLNSHAMCAGDCTRLSMSRDKHVKVRPLRKERV